MAKNEPQLDAPDLTLAEMGPSKEFQELYDSLNDGQRRFWYHYWMGGCLNKVEAARLAGYKTPGQSANQNFFSEAGRRMMKMYIDEFGITAASLMAELHRINMADVADFHELYDGTKSITELRDDGIDTRQIRKLKVTVTDYPESISPHTTVTTTIELDRKSVV